MDPMTIGMLVLAGLAGLSHIKDMVMAWRSGKPAAPSAPTTTPATPTLNSFTHGLLQSVLAAAQSGKLTPDHPLLSVLQAALQGVIVTK